MNSKIRGSKTVLPTYQEFIERKIFYKKTSYQFMEEEILKLHKELELMKINEQEVEFPLFTIAG